MHCAAGKKKIASPPDLVHGIPGLGRKYTWDSGLPGFGQTRIRTQDLGRHGSRVYPGPACTRVRAYPGKVIPTLGPAGIPS